MPCRRTPAARRPVVPSAVPNTVIAIPVRNEAERIEACLRAIDAQTGLAPGSLALVLFLNNCTDGTEAIVEALRPSLSLPMRVSHVTYAQAHAGWARREAMNAAVDWIGAASGGAILSTDADSRVPPDWVLRNLAALRAGADAVAGRIELDADEAALLPPSLHERGRLEDAYSAVLTEIEARIDPDPHDPWPCHRTTIGATLAVTREAYVAVGGMPAIALGEDGAFVAALLRQGYHVRHAPEVVVTVSGRLVGRAPGGVADTIRARCEKPESLCDARLEAVPRAVFRYLCRRHLRRLHGEGRLEGTRGWARFLKISETDAVRIAALPLPGLAVAEAERVSPRLVYRPLGPFELAHHTRLARLALVPIRALTRIANRRVTTPPPRPVAVGLEAP
ncbi:glycosyl transferase [Methylobacterium sp. Leaf469]|nr:glycosyl transferase [Methylobacterium sp. Leaf469]